MNPPGKTSAATKKFRRVVTKFGCRPQRDAFTLLELLVVIAILAALLLPALVRAKEQCRMVQCLSNLHQVGIAVRAYMEDYASRYPTFPLTNWELYQLGGGDPNPQGTLVGLERATNRLLWPYTHSRELFRCPADRGMNFSPWMAPFDSTYATLGTSYQYNFNSWCETAAPKRDRDYGSAGKPENWIRFPARYIMIHEASAAPCPPAIAGGPCWLYFFWHYARGPSTVSSPTPTLSGVRDRCISPVLFADGHAMKADFTNAMRNGGRYPTEEQPLWYWYEPAR